MKPLIITLTILALFLLGLTAVIELQTPRWDGFSCAINNNLIIHDAGSVTVYNKGREYVVEKEDGTAVRYIFSERPVLCIMKRG